MKQKYSDRSFLIVTHLRVTDCQKRKKCRAGIWFYSSVVDWIVRCGRCARKWRQWNYISCWLLIYIHSGLWVQKDAIKFVGSFYASMQN